MGMFFLKNGCVVVLGMVEDFVIKLCSEDKLVLGNFGCVFIVFKVVGMNSD